MQHGGTALSLPRFSLLPGLRRQLSNRMGTDVASTIMDIGYKASAYTEPDDPLWTVPHDPSMSEDAANNLASCYLMFQAYRRMAELYDMDPNMGMRFEPEQDLLIRAIFAARIRHALSPEVFARERARLCNAFGLADFSSYLYVCFPRRRGKSLAIGAADAILAATQLRFKIYVVNLGAPLAHQNMIYIRRIFNYLANDPDHVIKCKTGTRGKIPEFHSHFGSVNTIVCAANPDRSPEAARGMGGDLVVFDEAQWYKEGTYRTIMPITQVGSICVLISSLGSNDNFAAVMASRRNASGRLEFKHYVIQPGLMEVDVSSDEPGEGPPFSYKQTTSRQQREWYDTHAATPEMAREYALRDKLDCQRRFEMMCMALPEHISLENFLSLSVLMGEGAFNQELANTATEDQSESNSRPAFSSACLDWIGKEANYIDLKTLGAPRRVVTGVDPSKGTNSSALAVLTFAYYALSTAALQRPAEQCMVVRHLFFPFSLSQWGATCVK